MEKGDTVVDQLASDNNIFETDIPCFCPDCHPYPHLPRPFGDG